MPMTDEEIVSAYAKGLTCSLQYSMYLRGEYYSVLWHHSHAAYIDRMTGSRTCETEFILVRNGIGYWGRFEKDEFGQKKATELHTGRLLKADRPKVEEAWRKANETAKKMEAMNG